MNDAASALRMIREFEREMAKAVESVKREQVAALAAAHAQVGEAIVTAERRGRETARRHFAAVESAAEDEAKAIVEEGRRRAAALRDTAAPAREVAVTAMVELLLAPPSEKGK